MVLSSKRKGESLSSVPRLPESGGSSSEKSLPSLPPSFNEDFNRDIIKSALNESDSLAGSDLGIPSPIEGFHNSEMSSGQNIVSPTSQQVNYQGRAINQGFVHSQSPQGRVPSQGILEGSSKQMNSNFNTPGSTRIISSTSSSGIGSIQDEEIRTVRERVEMIEGPESVFVRVDKFKSAKNELATLKEKLQELESILSNIQGLRKKEDREIGNIDLAVDNLKRKISIIDSSVFNKI